MKKREKRQLSSRASRVDAAIHPTVSTSSSSICVAAVRDAMSKRDNRVQPNPRSLSAIFSSNQRHRHGNTWPNLKWISGPSCPGCNQKKEEEEKTALAAFDWHAEQLHAKAGRKVQHCGKSKAVAISPLTHDASAARRAFTSGHI